MPKSSSRRRQGDPGGRNKAVGGEWPASQSLTNTYLVIRGTRMFGLPILRTAKLFAQHSVPPHQSTGPRQDRRNEPQKGPNRLSKPVEPAHMKVSDPR